MCVTRLVEKLRKLHSAGETQMTRGRSQCCLHRAGANLPIRTGESREADLASLQR